MLPPLNGLKVLDLSRVLAGPWLGQLLADLGADVIKVESPEGDDTRKWGPPFVEGANGENFSACYYHACNRGKRSVVADFRTEEGRAFVKNLARHADIVVENFKVGGLAKYGLDHAGLKSVNPRLVYASITGFGQTGPYAERAGYDFLVQGMGGSMDLTGEPGGMPMKTGYAVADIFTGLYAAIGILAALRRRDETGEGAHIDCALLDSQVGVLGYQAINYLYSGVVPKRLGNAHPNIVPYEVFRTSDGFAIVATGNDRQYRDFCVAIGAGELAGHADYANNQLRVKNRKVLIEALNGFTERFTREALLARLEALKVPAGPINSVADIFEDPQVQARGIAVDLPAPYTKAGSIPSLRTPIVLDGVPQVAMRPSPRLGEHQDDVARDPNWGGQPA